MSRPPAEAQAVAHYCEHRHKCKWHADGAWPSFGTGEGREQAWKDAHAERCGGRILPLYAHPPPSAPVGVEGLNAVAVEAGHTTFESMKQCADSWLAVADALNTYTPGWGAKKGTGRECAVAAIAALAQQPAAVDDAIRRDAERYRWLRLHANTEWEAETVLHVVQAGGRTLDLRIDEALAAQQGGTPE